MIALDPGLSSAEADAKLKVVGPNELPNPDRRNFPRIVFEVLKQPMFALLLASGIVYLLLGETSDSVALMAFATLSVSISIAQEARSERVLESLRNLASPRALVIRDGIRKRIAGRNVVPGDLMTLAEGDRVPADAVLLDGVGGRGTDVAREANSLVLLDDDFATIVQTIKLGRRIYDNLGKAIQYIVAVHIPIAGLALLPLLFGLPLILMPIQIALLEMVIDPACSIVFES